MSQPNFSTNISSNTPVTGIGTGESINQAALAFVLVGTDDVGHSGLSTQTDLAAAYTSAAAAGRGVVIPSSNSAAIAALQTTAGYTYAVTLAAGTYVPIIRWTKNLVGGGTLAGNYIAGASVTVGTTTTTTTAAPTTFSDVFASDGGAISAAWTPGTGFSIVSNMLHWNQSSFTSDQHIYVNTLTPTNGEILAKLYVADISGLPTIEAINLMQRRTAANNYYCVRFQTNPAFQQIQLIKWVGGVGAVIGSAVALSPAPTVGDNWWVRYNLQGSTHLVRVWKDGTTEPGTWAINQTDAAIAAAGRIGIATGDSATRGDVLQFAFTQL